MNASALDPLPDDEADVPQLTLDDAEPAPRAPRGRQNEPSDRNTRGFKHAPFVAWQLCEED